MKSIARISVVPLLAAGLAAAQVPTALPDAGRILQQDSQSVPQSTAAPVLRLTQPTEAGDSAAVAAGPTTRVSELDIQGIDDTSLRRELEQMVLSAWRDKDVNLTDLRQIATQVQSTLRAAGFPFARALLPAQTLEHGRLQIRIIVGRYGEVTSSDPRAQQWLQDLRTGQSIGSKELERSLGVLAELPGVVSGATISASKQEGAGDLTVSVAVPQPVRAEIGVDNSGNRYSGYYRLRAGVDAYSLFEFGDQLSVRASLSEEKTSLGSVVYSMPLGVSGLRLGLNYNIFDYELGREFEALQANGIGKVFGVQLTYPIVWSQAFSLRAVSNYSTKVLEDRRDAVNLVEGRKGKLFSLGLGFDRRDSSSVTWGQITSGHGKLDLDSALLAADSVGLQTAGTYSKLNFDLSHLQRIGVVPVSVFARWSGQRASKNLDSSEKFSLGGASGVRAWPTGEGSGDEGDLLQLELRMRASELEPFVFWDAGKVRLSKRPLPAVMINTRTIAGAGLGVRWATQNWRAESSLGKTTLGGRSQSEPEARSTLLRFSLSYLF